MVAALFVVVGAAGSLYAFGAVRASVERSHKAFSTSSEEIAASLQLAIQHEQDLVVSTQSFVIGNPHPTQAQFTQWTNNVDVLQRYPELLSLVTIRYVPAGRLGTYATEASANQSTPFAVVPAGNHAFYCFPSIGLERGAAASAAAAASADDNLCAGPVARVIVAARNSGQSAVLPYTKGGVATLALDTPIYRSGTVPSTVAARVSSFVEVLGLEVRPGVLLHAALKDHPGTAVALSYGAGRAAVVSRTGHVPAGAETLSINLHNGWTVETLAGDDHGGLFGVAGGLVLLLGGIVLTLLLAGLIYVLGMGRASSRVLVDEQSDELRFQAMHDSLTGLPNGALHQDRQVVHGRDDRLT